MLLSFSKYHGAGNDFIIVDGRRNIQLTTEVIAQLCNRHFGIGADGLIMVKENVEADYEMVYYNADGNIGSMCGNGARCALNFARASGFISSNDAEFLAYDGIHSGKIISENMIRVSMSDVLEIKKLDEQTFETNTGSPHYVKFMSGINDMNIEMFGREIRYDSQYHEKGINVNVAEVISENHLRMRTYERGVEAETLACGTGTVAVALCYDLLTNNFSSEKEITIEALGGTLKVFFSHEKDSTRYSNIFLQGEARKVFDGSIEI